jgi:hypothetical protein
MVGGIEMVGAPNSTGTAIRLLGADCKVTCELQRERSVLRSAGYRWRILTTAHVIAFPPEFSQAFRS